MPPHMDTLTPSHRKRGIRRPSRPRLCEETIDAMSAKIKQEDYEQKIHLGLSFGCHIEDGNVIGQLFSVAQAVERTERS